MNCPPLQQLDLFDVDNELSVIGVTRHDLENWHQQDLISFDPQTPRLERWMLQEAAFIHHLTKVEWSVNALRKVLAPLSRPYLLDHGRHFFDFRLMQWRRRYVAKDLLDAAVIERPEDIGDVVRLLIRRLALAGERAEVLKTLAVLREVLPDDWLRDVRPEE